LRSAHFGRHAREAAALARELLDANPFTTLQVVLEPDGGPEAVRREVSGRLLGGLLAACQASPTYLDRFYALQPGRAGGAKRVVVLLPAAWRAELGPGWAEEAGEVATLAWRGAVEEEALAAHECAVS